jgi:hypothetical protein
MENVLTSKKLFHLLMKQHSTVIVKMVMTVIIVNYLKIYAGISPVKIMEPVYHHFYLGHASVLILHCIMEHIVNIKVQH